MKFSVVIPTQDRPALLGLAVKHAMQLDHRSFEVIVSDNSTSHEMRRLNSDVVRHYRSAPNFRLVAPPRVLSPPEHFEFTLDFATGDYLTYLTDKMVVLRRALADVEAAAKAAQVDIINWAYAPYELDQSRNPSGSGRLTEELEFLSSQPSTYDPITALRFKAGGAVARGDQHIRDYVLGKIVFGCFSRQLIERIRARSGTLFRGATHDYAAMIQALSLARSCVMLNRCEVLFLVLPRDESLGSATATEPRRALQYFQSFTEGDALLASLPIPGLYASQHNMVAYDYQRLLPLYGHAHLYDQANWLFAIRSDLIDESKVWIDTAEKRAQLQLFEEHVTRAGQRLPLQLRSLRNRFSWLTSRVRRRLLGGRDGAVRRTFAVGSLDEAIRRVSPG